VIWRTLAHLSLTYVTRQWSDVPGQMTAMLYGPDPEHPGSHPLAAQLRDHRAAWACPKTGILICLVGELAA
jgi:hypothetical protein